MRKRGGGPEFECLCLKTLTDNHSCVYYSSMELTTSRFCSQLQLIPSENSSHLLFFTLTSTKKQAYMQGRLNSIIGPRAKQCTGALHTQQM